MGWTTHLQGEDGGGSMERPCGQPPSVEEGIESSLFTVTVAVRGSRHRTSPYRAVPYLCCFSRPPRRGGLLGRYIFSTIEKFKDGRPSIENEQRSGRPSTSTTEYNIQQVSGLIYVHRKLTIKTIAKIVRISYGSCQIIFHEHSNLKKKTKNFVVTFFYI
ncbi:hypothetical protein LAZ67_21001725 [Cordylochernes scorpioides]|uniref:Uncharacterized protein n=1 Tax=Cordylochernes scorpioides TaxID=51811 RepID=A0ABY6LNA2_9ARAC|nr:hypothetical protein LAZ67_21001725 [Cordylochernes scorpioides]